MSGAIASAGRVLDTADRVGKIVVPAGATAEQESELIAIVVDPAEVRLDAGLGLRLAVGRLAGGLRDPGDELVADVLEQRQIHLTLRVEVLVEHRLGHAGSVSHVVHRRAMEALTSEDLEGDLEQLLTAGGS